MIAQFKRIYENAPDILKQAVRIVPFNYRMGRAYRRTLTFLSQSDRWSDDQYRQYQRTQLRILLERAIRYVPRYQRYSRLLGRDPFDILSEIEPVTKAQIQEDIEQFLVAPERRGDYHLSHTGGSSGRPLTIYQNDDAAEIEWAFIVIAWRRTGYRAGDKRISFRGVSFNQQGRDFVKSNPVYNEVYFSPFQMSEEHLQVYVDKIKKLRPRFIRGYPSVLTVLARFIEDRKTEGLPPMKALLCGSERLSDSQRKLLEKVFVTRAFSWYGMSEKIVFAAECEDTNTYHIFPQYGITEILDSHGKLSTAPGSEGEIVGTGFINNIMPFIRYRLEDYGKIIASHCEVCGRNHALLSKVRSHRVGDALVGRSGGLISMTALNIHDDTFAGVRQFQYHQQQQGKANLYLEVKPGFDRERRSLILKSLHARSGDEIDYAIEFVDQIDRTMVGKGIYLRQELDLTQFEHRQ